MRRLWEYNYTHELYHHGIKGQKWGRRRFQNEDGSLTPAGKARYDDDGPSQKSAGAKPTNVKVKRVDKLTEKYKAEGYGDKHAAEMAAKRVKTERIVAGAAALTVAACAVYATKKYIDYTRDTVVKADTEFQTMLALDKGVNVKAPKEGQYSTFLNSDKKKYYNRFGGHLQGRTNDKGEALDVYRMVSKSTGGDVKIASHKSSMKIFEKLLNEDNDFKEVIGGKYAPDKYSKKDLKKLYENFNVGLVDGVTVDKNASVPFGVKLGARENANAKFFKALRDAGYDALEDVNDQKFYRPISAKMPTIIVRPEKFVSEQFKLTPEELTKTYNSRISRGKNIDSIVDNMLWRMSADKDAVIGYGAFAGGVAGLYGINVAQIRKEVNNYKKAHPNTNMTDAQITDMVKEKMGRKR